MIRELKHAGQLKITKNQTDLYNMTVKEIKEQEKKIAKLPATHQKSANAALQITKTYRDRYEDYQAAIKASDNLSALHETFSQSVKKGELSPLTVTEYEQLEKEILATETKIKNMATSRVRTLATEKYVNPIKNDVPAIDNILSRYTLLVQIDQKLTNQEQATEDWAELEKLEQQAPTLEAYELAEQFLQQWQETLKQAHSAGVPATDAESATVVEDSAA